MALIAYYVDCFMLMIEIMTARKFEAASWSEP